MIVVYSSSPERVSRRNANERTKNKKQKTNDEAHTDASDKAEGVPQECSDDSRIHAYGISSSFASVRTFSPSSRRVVALLRLSLVHDEFIEQWPQSLVQEVSECGDHHRRFAIARRGRIFSRVAPSRVPSDRPDAARTIIHRCKPIARAHLHRARALVRARSSHRARAVARTVIARTAWSRRRRGPRARAAAAPATAKRPPQQSSRARSTGTKTESTKQKK